MPEAGARWDEETGGAGKATGDAEFSTSFERSIGLRLLRDTKARPSRAGAGAGRRGRAAGACADTRGVTGRTRIQRQRGIEACQNTPPSGRGSAAGGYSSTAARSARPPLRPSSACDPSPRTPPRSTCSSAGSRATGSSARSARSGSATTPRRASSSTSPRAVRGWTGLRRWRPAGQRPGSSRPARRSCWRAPRAFPSRRSRPATRSIRSPTSRSPTTRSAPPRTWSERPSPPSRPRSSCSGPCSPSTASPRTRSKWSRWAAT